jgi:hypothetical protein
MSRGPQTFRRKDVTRAIKAVEAAGKSVREVAVEKDGRIVVLIGFQNTVPSRRRSRTISGRSREETALHALLD